MINRRKFPHIAWLFFLFGALFFLGGCLADAILSKWKPTLPGPEEKVYRLQVGRDLQVPIDENEALVYRFDAVITSDGLYQFETRGDTDTLCSLVYSQNNQERYIVVKDIGGEGENCRIIWAFAPGVHQFKVRVDGRGQFSARLRRIPWGQSVGVSFEQDKNTENVLEKVEDRHQFRFQLSAPRLVQLRATGKGLLQCILRKSDGSWLTTPDFRQPYGACTLGNWLPSGSYTFELRGDQPNTKYKLTFQQVRMQDLASEKVQEGFLKGKHFDIFRVNLQDNRRHILQTYGEQKLHCTLEDKLGHVIAAHQDAQDGHNCRIIGQFAPGSYFLRVKLQRKPGGFYQVSLRQQAYKVLPLQTTQTITPDFQSPQQLYQLNIPEPLMYEIDIQGRPLQCQVQGTDNRLVPTMQLSDSKRCLLFVNFQAGSYFLQVIPTSREELPYQLRIRQYKPQQGDSLEDHQPRLVGPVYPGYKATFKIESKHPQIVTIETRGELDTICKLFDLSGGELASDDDSGRRLNCQITRYLKPGQYQLKVSVGGRISGIFWLQRRQKKLPWLQAGTPINDVIKGKKRPQNYLLKVSQTGLYSFRTEGKLDTVCLLLDNEWRKITENDDASNSDKNCFFTRLLTPGVYAVQVKLYQEQQGPFKLVVEQLKLRNLAPDQPYRDSIHGHHLTRFYRIQITKPDLYSIYTLGALDTKCKLIDQQGRQLSENDDGYSPNDRDKNCEILENLHAGVYFFQVWLYNSNSGRSSRGPHFYQAVFAKKTASIKKIPVETQIDGTLAPGQVTRFVFHVKKSGRYRIETHGKLDPKCMLLDGTLRQIAKDDDSGLDRNCRIEWRLQPGTYEVQVQPANKFRNRGNYRIGVFRRGS